MQAIFPAGRLDFIDRTRCVVKAEVVHSVNHQDIRERLAHYGEM